MRKIIIIILINIMAFNLHAQINLKDKIKNQTLNRADQKADQGVGEGLDTAEEGVKNIFKKKEKTEDSDDDQPQNQENKVKAKDTKSQDQPVSFASYSKYDFVPGDQVILFEDFSQDAIGDFPELWTTDGSGEVKTTNLYSGKFLHMNTSHKAYNLMKDLKLPNNYIFEFDVIPTNAESHGSCSFYLSLYQDDGDFLNNDLLPGTTGFHLNMSTNDWGVTAYTDGSYGITGNSSLATIEENKLSHIIMWVQNRRVRIYHKGSKVLDLPTILPANVAYNRLRFGLWSQDGLPYVTNIRFTTAAPDIRSKLLTEGKLVSYGIYFDVNSDKVKSESYGSIKQIADVLQENPGVKIKIIGHTDSDGDDAKNLDLSKRRAASVKNELVNTFKINAASIETDGKGESEAIAPNNTSEGKAQNRRVEFIKM